MAQSRLVLPIPHELVLSRFETHFATELVLTPDVRLEEFCNQFEAMVCSGVGRMMNGTIIVHTEQLGLKHVSMTNIDRVKQMYMVVFKKLKESIHSSIIVAPNAFVQSAINVVLRASRKEGSATEVSVVRTTEDAWDKAREIAAQVHVPALKARLAERGKGTTSLLTSRSKVLLGIALCAISLWSMTLDKALPKHIE